MEDGLKESSSSSGAAGSPPQKNRQLMGFGNVSIPKPAKWRRWFHMRSKADAALSEVRRHAATQIKTLINRNALFLQLPYDVHLQIMTYLDPESLAHAALVSRDFCSMCNDPSLWKLLFERDKQHWTISGTNADIWSALLQDINDIFQECLDESAEEFDTLPTVNWKLLYVEHHLMNKKTSVQRKRTYQKALVIENPKHHNLKLNDPYRIPMFYNAEEAHMLLDSMMWGESFPFPVAALYPGIDGFGSGVGFEINKKLLNIAALYRYTRNNKLWEDYLKSADGFIFIMDNIRDEKGTHLQNTFEQLQEMLVNMPGKPLLVFALSFEGTEQYTSFELATQLGLHRKQAYVSIHGKVRKERQTFLSTQSWCVRCCTYNDMAAISDGIEWLAARLN